MPSFSRPTILMCPADYYGIEYEINPWMSRSCPAEPEESRRQWKGLHDLLESSAADVRLMAPERGLPDLVFTANAGLVWRDVVFLSRFRHLARQGETEFNDRWFHAQGFETVALPEQMSFEGAGDALFCGDTLYGGYIFRSDARALQWVGSQIGCRVIPLQLVDSRYYHLDTCFCPLSPTEAIWFPPAFDDYGRRVLQENIPTLVEAVPEEAARFACNAVVVQKHVITNTGCPRLGESLSRLGYTPLSTELGEFIKAGGSAKCLTLRIDGEDAARWPERTGG